MKSFIHEMDDKLHTVWSATNHQEIYVTFMKRVYKRYILIYINYIVNSFINSFQLQLERKKILHPCVSVIICIHHCRCFHIAIPQKMNVSSCFPLFVVMFFFNINDIYNSSNKLHVYLAANDINLLHSILIKA